MTNTIITNSAEQTRNIAAELAAKLLSKTKTNQFAQIICLSGDLGAGKTTFAQGLLDALGAETPYTSPTFVIMRQYEIAQNPRYDTIYHIDPYRIDAPALIDLGWREICANPRNLIILEWPEIVQEIIPPNTLNIKIASINEQTRKLTIK